MSQIETMLIMLELGASKGSYIHVSKIKDEAEKKFPDLSLHSYVKTRLSTMKRKGYVTNDGKGNWTVIDDSLIRDRNIYT